eukprot:m.79701 g.79701  ORF g.79701 m.79701 type:complete len:201 (+) comp17432_c0_seq2:852-1454(+)
MKQLAWDLPSMLMARHCCNLNKPDLNAILSRATSWHRPSQARSSAWTAQNPQTAQVRALLLLLLLFSFIWTTQIALLSSGLCPAGAFKAQLQCLPCAMGSYSALLSAAATCSLCPSGHYAASEGQSACVPCSAGESAVGTGATFCSQCANAFITSNTGADSCAKLTEFAWVVIAVAATLIVVPACGIVLQVYLAERRKTD